MGGISGVRKMVSQTVKNGTYIMTFCLFGCGGAVPFFNIRIWKARGSRWRLLPSSFPIRCRTARGLSDACGRRSWLGSFSILPIPDQGHAQLVTRQKLQFPIR